MAKSHPKRTVSQLSYRATIQANIGSPHQAPINCVLVE
jgi:hypothetical protein